MSTDIDTNAGSQAQAVEGAVLRFQDVSHGYGEGPVLRGASFEITPGSLTLLLGPSGSGKSTALQLAAGLDKARSGIVSLEGRDLGLCDRSTLTELRRRSVALIFQDGNLLEGLRALENVEYPLLIRGDPRTEARAASQRALEDLGLGHLATRFPEQLSGGERQRVAIARALAQSPRLLLADEPSAHLDGDSAKSLFELLATLAHSHRTAVLAATHDARVLGYADRILEVSEGQVLEGDA